MLPSSVRRVVASTPQSHLVSSLAAPSHAPRTAAAAACLLSRGHNRRYSSSKPSSSDNGSKDLPAGQSVPAASGSSARSTAKASGEKRKGKRKGTADGRAAMNRLPSVPSTQHLSQEALALSTFFSMHRPISVTHSLPKTVTDDAFAAIFAPRTKANKMSDVISTLSRSVDELEGPVAKMTISNKQQEGADAAWDPVHKIDVKYPDGSESSVYVQLNSMAGQFLPFRPPPVPEPQSALETDAAAAEADADAAALAIDAAEAAVALVEDAEPQHRVYKAMFTIEETTDPDGQVRVVAHSPKILHDEQPRSFLERMALRHLRFEDAQRRDRGSMLAISVKRQRKLKMKKKKYKKLQRRTRNQRRRLGQL